VIAEAPTPTAPTTRERRNALMALTLLHTINDFYGLLLPPLLPALKAAFDLSYTQTGAIPFVATGVSALLQPTLGYVADRRLARRLFMAGGFVGFGVAALWLSTASSYGWALFGAALLGLAGSTYHPQSATYLVYYFRDRRGFAQGIHGLGNGLGFLLAPLVVAALAESLGWPTAVRLAAIPAFLGAAIVFATLREPTLRGGAGMAAGVTGPLVRLTIVTGLALFASVGFQSWLPSYYAALDYSLGQAGLFTGAMFAAGMVAQPSGGTLSDRFGRRAVVLASLLGVALFQALFVATGWLPLMLGLSLLVGFFGSLLPPVAMVYASELAAGQRTGMAVGVVWGLGTAISAFAPLVTGGLIDLFGFGVAYLAMAAVALVAALVAGRLPRPG
jgi:FSR family fosmidomycin resistance protein-like MFS transporter